MLITYRYGGTSLLIDTSSPYLKWKMGVHRIFLLYWYAHQIWYRYVIFQHWYAHQLFDTGMHISCSFFFVQYTDTRRKGFTE